MQYRSNYFGPLILSLILSVCFFPGPGESAEPVHLGVLHSEGFAYAEMMKNSFEMALDAINQEGGIKGRPLKLIYGNDRGKRGPGEEVVKELVKKSGVVMLVGGYQSSNTIYTARTADKMNMPFLVCTAADDRITQRKWKNVYRLNPPASEYTKGVEDLFSNRIKPESMSIVYENSPYGTSAALRMMWFCRENDIGIQFNYSIPQRKGQKESIGSSYFQYLLEPLKKNSPHVIYMVSYLNDGALLVKNIRKLQIESILCGGAGGFTHQKFIKKTGELAEHLLTATLWTQQLQYPGTKEYYRQYEKRHSAPPDYHGAEAYSVLLVAADALRRAESLQPASIRDALDSTDMMTSFGPVKFSAYEKFERQNSLPTQVLQIIKGRFECVWPENLATSKFTPPSFERGSD